MKSSKSSKLNYVIVGTCNLKEQISLRLMCPLFNVPPLVHYSFLKYFYNLYQSRVISQLHFFIINLKKIKNHLSRCLFFYQYDKNIKRKLLRLNKTLNELHQSHRDIWKYLTKKLISIRMLWYNIYPCLFIDQFFAQFMLMT